MMAAGGLVAAAGFATAAGSRSRSRSHLPVWGPVELPVYRLAAWRGLGLGLAFLVAGRAAGLRPAGGTGQPAHPRRGPRGAASLHGPAPGPGLFWSSGGWILLGLSQLAVIRSFDPAGAEALLALGLAPVVIASVAWPPWPGLWWRCFPAGWACARAC